MLKSQGFSKIFVCILLGGFLIFGLTSIGFSGGEPPAGSKTTGKAIDAVITAVLIGSISARAGSGWRLRRHFFRTRTGC